MLNQVLYTTQHIAKMTDLIESERTLREDETHKKWIFRGQRCHTEKGDFDLMPSLERMARGFDLDIKDLLCIECWSLREFKRRLHHYTTNIPGESDKLEWLALMQHYGAPTRLLDWTYSFFVAVFFAIESFDKCDAEVWALNADYFSADARMIPEENYCEIRQRVACANDPTSRGLDRAMKFQDEIVDYLWSKPVPCVCSVNPLRLNERLAIQQGVFLFPGNINQSFEDNLSAEAYKAESKQNLIRFTIKSELRKEILSWLYRFNITQATLFPGLDGFARSFNTRLAFLPEIATELRCKPAEVGESVATCCGRSLH